MALPFQPESVEQMQVRYMDSLKKSYNIDKIKASPEDRPGNRRENVFDFEQGIRLIISREEMKGEEVIHFSASLVPEIIRAREEYLRADEMLERMKKLFCEVSHIPESRVEYIGMSGGKGVPHWCVRTNSLN